MGWVVGWSIIELFDLISLMRDAIRLVVGWFVINYVRKGGTQFNWVQYKWMHVGVGERLFHHHVCNA